MQPQGQNNYVEEIQHKAELYRQLSSVLKSQKKNNFEEIGSQIDFFLRRWDIFNSIYTVQAQFPQFKNEFAALTTLWLGSLYGLNAQLIEKLLPYSKGKSNFAKSVSLFLMIS